MGEERLPMKFIFTSDDSKDEGGHLGWKNKFWDIIRYMGINEIKLLDLHNLEAAQPCFIHLTLNSQSTHGPSTNF